MAKKIDYDTQWKAVIEAYFNDFVDFFLPELYKEVDFSFAPQFMDKELHELIAEKTKGSRKGDQLVKVKLKSGEEQWIFIHIEVQSYHDKDFALRMFATYYRVWDRFGIDVVALAIFTSRHKMPTKYEKKAFGTLVSYTYESYYIKGQDKTELLKTENVFGLIVLASLYALESKNKNEQRLIFKKKLLYLLLERGYDRLDIRKLFIFIQNILKLPEKLEIEFVNEVEKIKSMDNSQPYITKYNRMFAKKFYLAMHGDDAEMDVSKIVKNLEQDLKEKLEQKSKEEIKKLEQKNRREVKKAEKEAKKKTVLNLFTNTQLTVEQIAENLELPLSEVEKILKKNKLIQ